MQRHRQHPVGAGGQQQVGNHAPADRDARRILLVRAGIGIMRDHRGDPGRRSAARRVEHQQQFDQMILHRRTQRLDQEHVLLAAIGLQLHFDAVVGEALYPRRQQRNVEFGADPGREFGMRATTEDGNLAHRGAPRYVGIEAGSLWQNPAAAASRIRRDQRGGGCQPKRRRARATSPLRSIQAA
jgi:hypothetical protein